MNDIEAAKLELESAERLVEAMLDYRNKKVRELREADIAVDAAYDRLMNARRAVGQRVAKE